MHRRDLLKAFFAAGLTPVLGPWAMAENRRYEGPIYITVFAEGGWDVTSLCDPKDGQRLNPANGNTVWINHWAEAGQSIATTNNGLRYAPFADNERLFQTLGSKMLVINGIDTQTNAHNAGVRHTFSGRFADGYPAQTALAAARHGAGLPLAFLSNGGYRETAGLTQFTLMQDPSTLNDLINPNDPTWVDSHYHRPESLDLIAQARQARLDRLLGQQQLRQRLQEAADMDQRFGTNLVSRLRVVVASDFGRTPWYNDGDGKDHWPLGSAILMRDNGFSRNSVGGTSDQVEALSLNGDLSLNPDPQATQQERIIRPAHLQQLLRYWANIEHYNSTFPLETGSLDLRSMLG
ncbi:MAG: DUF1501 domain-containing protein [Saccharospirillum sp.]|nr:DUF1501 domain-containing protein [Saccharospirillum sp.]